LICLLGIYQLAPSFSKQRIDPVTWGKMTKQEKDAKKKRFCGKFPDITLSSGDRDSALPTFNTQHNVQSATNESSTGARSSNVTYHDQMRNASKTTQSSEEGYSQPSTSGLQRYRDMSLQEDDNDYPAQQNIPSSLSHPRFPDFAASGLPGHLSVDWDGAGYYLENFFISVEKLKILEDSYLVKSRSQDDMAYKVKARNSNVICECPRFKSTQGVCAHSITIAYHLDILEFHLSKWAPRPEIILQEIQPDNAGKKKSQKSRKRKKTSERQERSTDGYVDKRPARPIIEDNEKFHLVYINQTRSTTCHGCHKKYRQTERSELPPAPFDMVLGIKIHRLYPVKGSSQLRLSKTKENCYFHLKRKCLQAEFPDRELTIQDLVVDMVVSPPKMAHKLKLREEFRITL